jgi:iron complex transport system substrate-binding protein
MRKGVGFLFQSIAVAAVVAPTLAAALPRIASMNVCTDQLLIPLADP